MQHCTTLWELQDWHNLTSDHIANSSFAGWHMRYIEHGRLQHKRFCHLCKDKVHKTTRANNRGKCRPGNRSPDPAHLRLWPNSRFGTWAVNCGECPRIVRLILHIQVFGLTQTRQVIKSILNTRGYNSTTLGTSRKS